MKTIILIITLIAINVQAQHVGINNPNPTQSLDVNGDTYANKLFIKNMFPPEIPGGTYIAGNTASPPQLGVYGQTSSLFTYIPVEFTNVNSSGILEYDTKISDTEYILVLHNYQLMTSTGGTNVSLDFIGDINRQGSPEFTTQKKDGTWWVTAKFTNSKMINTSNSNSTQFKIKLYLIAYKYIITKQNIDDIQVNQSTQTSIAAPPGF